MFQSFPPPNEGKLLGLQAARGVAAMLVVAFHAERAIGLPQYAGQRPFGGLATFGHAGVDFFFVLSGFIILTAHRADIGRPGALARYAGRRISRIYPAYWVVTAATALALMAGPGRDTLPSWQGAAASLLLIPHGADPIAGVAWTLEWEMTFYVVFGLAILSRRLAIMLAAAWAVLAAACAVMPGGGPHYGRLAFASYDLQFAIGLAAAWLSQRSPPSRPILIVWAGVAAFLAAGMAETADLLPEQSPATRAAYGLASGMAVVGLTWAERQGRLRVGRTMTLLGGASYSIYLIHLTPIMFAVQAMTVLGVVALVPGWVVMAGVCALAAAYGVAFHLVIERRLTLWAQRLAAGLTTPKAQAVPAP